MCVGRYEFSVCLFGSLGGGRQSLFLVGGCVDLGGGKQKEFPFLVGAK